MTSFKIIFLMDDILYFCLWTKKAFNSIYYGAPYNEKLTRKSLPQWNLKCLWRGKKQESRDVSTIISLINDIFLRHCWTVPYVLKTSEGSGQGINQTRAIIVFYHWNNILNIGACCTIWWHKKIKVVHKSIYISL